LQFETLRLNVRNFVKTDSDDLYEYLSDPYIYLYEPGEPIDKGKALLLASERSNSDVFLAVEDKSSGKMIGHLYFEQIKPHEMKTFELGYIFNKEYHNQGFGTEAVLGLFRNIYKSDFYRIIANCNPKNIGSWKLLENVGMRREAHFLKNHFFRYDENNVPIWFDSYQYAILKEEMNIE
jgi:[ribosomal protein S5]-alanine N-acetyltransferase